jgi:hypothetical protein
MYRQHGTVVSERPVYSTVCIMVGPVSHFCTVCMYTLHGTVVSEHLLYSILCTILQSLRCHIYLYLQTPQSDSHSFLSCSSLSLFRNAIYPHSTLLYEVSRKSPSSPSWLYASLESASCLEYKLYSVTCKQFSVLWLSKSNHVSILVWIVFWMTVRSNINHWFTCLLRAQLLRSTTK